MRGVGFILLLASAGCSPGQNQLTETTVAPADSGAVVSVPNIRHVIIPAESASGFGYDIFMDDKLYIHQPTVPAVPGMQGFPTQAQAERAALFVEYKIRNNILPPAVSVGELDSLGVLK